jgi:hypothetical protein
VTSSSLNAHNRAANLQAAIGFNEAWTGQIVLE